MYTGVRPTTEDIGRFWQEQLALPLANNGKCMSVAGSGRPQGHTACCLQACDHMPRLEVTGEENGMQAAETLTLDAWRGYQRDTFPTGSWVYEDGMLRSVAKAERIDLITRQQYQNFALALEWRVARGGNSGILYRISETMPHTWQSGPEMQLLDDDHHPDGQTPDTTAGALYGVMAPWCKAVRPPGSFNTARLVVRDSQVEHWLNEELVLAYDLHSVTFAAAVARRQV